jgi:hypothetical protein
LGGLLVLFLGIQLRLVESFVLNDATSKAIASRMKRPVVEQPMGFINWTPDSMAIPEGNRKITPPKAIGWIMISAGVVTVLHSLAMRREGA